MRELFFYFSVMAQEKQGVGVNVSAWHAISSASPIVQLTLLTLIAMSIGSWAIIVSKRKQIRDLQNRNKPFMELFWRASSLDEIYSSLDPHAKSSLAQVFKAGFVELKKIAESNLADKKEKGSPFLTGIDNLDRSLRKEVDNQVALLESRLSFLATTGSTCPFIGLFGTVWGIMNAFQTIAATGMASLAVVAPGISEALIATAVGLAAAIPATVAYNHFVVLLRKQELELNNFAADFLNIAKRNFFKDQ